MKLAIVDDDKAVLHSLTLLLEPRAMEVSCFSSAEDFLASLHIGMPDCVIADVLMPGMSGIDLQRELKKRGSTVPVILVTGHGDIPMAVQAIKEGAFDFIEKPFDEEPLLKTIQAALKQGRELSIEQFEDADLVARMAQLSPRQREVMDLVARGLSNKQIAQRLDLSSRTVENYRAWVMEKMGATSLAELVRMAMRLRK